MSAKITRVWRPYTGHLAWPTVGLASVTLALWSSVVLLHAVGSIPTIAACPLSILACYLWLTPAHEAAHGNIGGREHPWLDELVGWTAMACLLGPFNSFRVMHLRHHSHTNHPEHDPDMWLDVSWPFVPFRCATIVPYYWFHFLWPPPALRKPAHRPILHVSLMFFAVVGTGLAAMCWCGLWTTVVWVMIVPSWAALSMLAIVFDWLPHFPHERQDRYLNSRAYPSRLLDVFLLGQNYHLVHHLWPKVPWYRYSTVFALTRHHLLARGAPLVFPLLSVPEPAQESDCHD